MSESEDKAFDLTAKHDTPHAFIQWKGTDVCMDFWCECGATCHFDGDFACVVKCPHCDATYQMPSILFPRRVNDPGPYHEPKMMERDEELDED